MKISDISFVTIHGMFGSSSKHLTIRDYASKVGFHVNEKSFDFNRSNPRTRTYEDNKEQVIDHLNRIPRKHLELCGHSKGGLLAQDIKDEDLDGKEIVGRVLINSAAPKGINPIRNWTQALCILTSLHQLLTGEILPSQKYFRKLIYNAHKDLGIEYDLKSLIPEPVPVFLDVAHWGVPVTPKPNVRVIGADRDMITPLAVQKDIAHFHDAPEPTVCIGHDHGSVCKDIGTVKMIIDLALQLIK